MLIYATDILKIIICILLALEKVVYPKFSLNTTDISEISSYLQYFNNEILLNKTTQLSVVQSVRHRTAKYYLDELLNDYLKKINYIKVNLKEVQRSYAHSFDYFNIILIDSYESFRDINPGPVTSREDFSEYYIIIYYSLSKQPKYEIKEIFKYCWQYFTVNVSLLLKTYNDEPILLYTYYPFTQNSCKNVELHLINNNKSILLLKEAEIFPNKFINFHNCTLTAALWNVPPYLILPPPERATQSMTGIEGYLLNVLGKVLNFTLKYIVPPNNEQRGLVNANGSFTGAIKMLSERTADFSLGSFRCTFERSTLLSPSITFCQTKQVFSVLSLRQSWSGLEILAYPFQLHIWIVLLILMLFLLSSSYILQFYDPNILRFIHGFSSVYFINTNIIAITLNQTALFLPQRNFSRYIFLMWILLTMILRSIYQGALFDFLKTQQNIAPPDTIKDLLEREYKLIVNVATNDSFSGLPIVRNKQIEVVIMNISDDGGFPLLELNSDKRYVTGTPKDFLTYYVKSNGKHGVFHVLKETIFSQQLCVYFTKHSYLVKSFDCVLENLQNFGLIDYWASQLMDDRILEEIREEITETPLTLSQLSGIIHICMILYFFAIVVFICEILWFKSSVNE